VKKNKKSGHVPLPLIDLEKLPDDVGALKHIIVSQAAHISTLETRLTRLEQSYAKIARLHFGQSSEKMSTLKTPPEESDAPLSEEITSADAESANEGPTHNQCSIKNANDNNALASKNGDVKKEQKTPKSRANHKGRNPLAGHLTRHEVKHDLKGDEKICTSCGSFLSFIGIEEREQLEAAIERYMVLVHRRKKYACKNKSCTSQTIKVAPTPVEAIEKGLAGPHLLAEVIVDKYCDHLPLYRQERRFARQGITLNRSTIWSWIKQSALLLTPLAEQMVQHQMAASHMFSDETTIPTLWAHTPENKGKQAKTNYFWVYTSLLDDKKDKPIVVYRFAEGRDSLYPMEFLKDFKGYLQADAYSGYNPLFIPKWDDVQNAYVQWCTEVGCFAHARRYFMDALKSNPLSIAKEVILLIGDLYLFEAEFKEKNLTYDQIKEKRQELSRPKLDEIYLWLQTYQPQAAPKSLLGVAIGYAFNNWGALCTYLNDGRLEIDNTRSERNMKGIAVGRKNYLFVASNQGGTVAATLYSLVETCRQNGVDPKVYLADVLQRISTHPNARIDELLPYYWEPLSKTTVVALKDSQKAA
jgi:transposase